MWLIKDLITGETLCATRTFLLGQTARMNAAETFPDRIIILERAPC